MKANLDSLNHANLLVNTQTNIYFMEIFSDWAQLKYNR